MEGLLAADPKGGLMGAMWHSNGVQVGVYSPGIRLLQFGAKAPKVLTFLALDPGTFTRATRRHFHGLKKKIYGAGLRIEADPADPLRAYNRAQKVDFG